MRTLMLALLSSAIYILICSLVGADARAVHTTIASLPTAEISSSILAGSVNGTASPQRCGDIDNCRTLNGIIQSCLVTILACVWFAVHRNIPAPKREPSYHSNIVIRCVQRAWSVVLDQREAAMVFGVALIAPEWILAWAVRQAVTAWRLVKKLEIARLEGKGAQMDRLEGSSHAEDIRASEAGHSSMDGSVATHAESETGLLMKRRSKPSIMHSTCNKCEGRGCQCDLFAAAKRVAKGDERWAMSHAFFVAMGGFCFYNEDGPIYPLSPANVIELVKRGHLVPPTADEISNQSKGDALSKGVAIGQTLWFVIQCIARRTENLPVTNLEVMTLAYTVMTVAMYATWWAKPLNVSCAIRVPEEDVEYSGADDEYDSIWERIVIYVMGGQDDYTDLRQRKRVPTFWAGEADNEDAYIADAIALLVAMAFGAVHCIAWYSEFQSPFERQLWRWSAITIIAVPAVLVVLLFVVNTISECLSMDDEARITMAGALYAPVSIVYIAARLTLIFLSFTSLRGLPVSAYQTVQWTTFIPHI